MISFASTSPHQTQLSQGKSHNILASEPSIVSSLEIPLKLLRLLGLFPLSFTRDGKGELQLKFRWFSFPTLWVCLLYLTFAIGNLGEMHYNPNRNMSLRREQDVLKTLKLWCTMFHSAAIYFFLLYFNLRYPCFEDILMEFNELPRSLKLTRPNKKLKYFATMISIIYLLLTVSENAMYVYTSATTNLGEVGLYSPIQYTTENTDIMTALMAYYHFNINLPHTKGRFLLIGKIIQQALRSYAWNFVDVLMVLLFRVISFRFKALAENAIHIARNYSDKKGSSVWEDVRSDYEQLHGLLKKLNAFLSPPLLLSYCVNVILMAMHLSQWIISKEKNNEQGVPIYASMSSFLLILRTVMLTHYGSEIHENAHLILTAVEKCSSSVYSIPMERLERKLATQRIGVKAGGVFFISRSLFASITSVIFTIEIFLLQAGQPPPPPSQKDQ